VKATEVTAGLAESNGSLLPGLWRDSVHVTWGLTACTPGAAPGLTLGNGYGKTLPFTYTHRNIAIILCHSKPVAFTCSIAASHTPDVGSCGLFCVIMFFIKVLKHVLTCYSDDALLRTRLISLSIIVITIVLGPTCTTSVHFNGETESLRLKLYAKHTV